LESEAGLRHKALKASGRRQGYNDTMNPHNNHKPYSIKHTAYIIGPRLLAGASQTCYQSSHHNLYTLRLKALILIALVPAMCLVVLFQEDGQQLHSPLHLCSRRCASGHQPGCVKVVWTLDIY